MWRRIKTLFKSTAFNIFCILALAGIVLYFTLKDDYEQVFAVLKNVNVKWLIAIICMMIFERVMLGWGLMKEAKQSHPHYTLLQGFVNAYTSGLFCNITPGASGGQIGQGYMFRKQGVPVSHSVGILWLDFIVYQSTMTVFVAVLLILRFHYFYANYSQYFLIVLAGFAVSAAIIVFLWVLATVPKFYYWLSTSGINLGVKLHLVKDKELTLQKLDTALAGFSKEIVVLRTHKLMIVQLVIENLLRLALTYSIPFFCAQALGFNVGYDQLLNIIALSSFVAMVNAFLPMPGSAGGTEAMFVLMFGTIFTQVEATSVMILWRLVTFYQTLIVGGIVFAIARSQPDVQINPEEKNTPRTYTEAAMQEEAAS